MGERLLRELQLEAPRRAAGWRDLLLPRRGSRRDRAVARPLQYSAAPLVSGLSTARAGGHPLAAKAERDLSPVRACLGTEAYHALRLKPDRSIGAGHGRPGGPFTR